MFSIAFFVQGVVTVVMVNGTAFVLSRNSCDTRFGFRFGYGQKGDRKFSGVIPFVCLCKFPDMTQAAKGAKFISGIVAPSLLADTKSALQQAKTAGAVKAVVRFPKDHLNDVGLLVEDVETYLDNNPDKESSKEINLLTIESPADMGLRGLLGF